MLSLHDEVRSPASAALYCRGTTRQISPPLCNIPGCSLLRGMSEGAVLANCSAQFAKTMLTFTAIQCWASHYAQLFDVVACCRALEMLHVFATYVLSSVCAPYTRIKMLLADEENNGPWSGITTIPPFEPLNSRHYGIVDGDAPSRLFF